MLGYETELVLSDEDITEDGYIKTSRLFHIFENVATDHVESINMGGEEMLKKGYIWVLSKLKYETLGKVSSGKRYSVATYPRPKKSVTFGREYFIYDEDRNVMVTGTSQWCVLNFKSRRIERTDINFEGEFFKDWILECRFDKIHAKEPVLVGKHIVSEDDLDMNGHVNNCRYVDFVCEATGQKAFDKFNIYFVKETMPGDEILLYYENTEEGHTVIGTFEDGSEIFKASGSSPVK